MNPILEGRHKIVFRTFWVSFYSLPLLSDRRSPFHCPSSEQTCGNFTTFQFNWIPEALACTFLPRLHWLLYIFLMFFYLCLRRPSAKQFFRILHDRSGLVAFIGMARFMLSCEMHIHLFVRVKTVLCCNLLSCIFLFLRLCFYTLKSTLAGQCVKESILLCYKQLRTGLHSYSVFQSKMLIYFVSWEIILCRWNVTLRNGCQRAFQQCCVFRTHGQRLTSLI